MLIRKEIIEHEKMGEDFIKSLSRGDVLNLLKEWVDSGLLVSPASLGTSRVEINKAFDAGTLFPTSFDGVVATNLDTQLKFEELVDAKRIMSYRKVMIVTGLTSAYSINKEVKRGEIGRFDALGRTGILLVV